MGVKAARLTLTFLFAHVLVAPVFADDLDMNKWEDVVALRLRSGATPSKECSQSWCDAITTLPADHYGTVRQTIEATGSVKGRWECSIDKNSTLRSCSGFEREALWRLDRRDANGKFALLKIGTFDEINALEKTIWRSQNVPAVSPSLSLSDKSTSERQLGTGPFGDEVPVDGLPLGLLQKIYFQFDNVCRGGAGDSDRTNAFCSYREAVSRAIYKIGYCFSYPQYTWRRCRANDPKPW